MTWKGPQGWLGSIPLATNQATTLQIWYRPGCQGHYPILSWTPAGMGHPHGHLLSLSFFPPFKVAFGPWFQRMRDPKNPKFWQFSWIATARKRTQSQLPSVWGKGKWKRPLWACLPTPMPLKISHSKYSYSSNKHMETTAESKRIAGVKEKSYRITAKKLL